MTIEDYGWTYEVRTIETTVYPIIRNIKSNYENNDFMFGRNLIFYTMRKLNTQRPPPN